MQAILGHGPAKIRKQIVGNKDDSVEIDYRFFGGAETPSFTKCFARLVERKFFSSLFRSRGKKVLKEKYLFTMFHLLVEA